MGFDCCRGNRYGGADRPDADYDFGGRGNGNGRENNSWWKWLVGVVLLVLIWVVLKYVL